VRPGNDSMSALFARMNLDLRAASVIGSEGYRSIPRLVSLFVIAAELTWKRFASKLIASSSSRLSSLLRISCCTSRFGISKAAPSWLASTSSRSTPADELASRRNATYRSMNSCGFPPRFAWSRKCAISCEMVNRWRTRAWPELYPAPVSAC
jgi:hypothetical protein